MRQQKVMTRGIIEWNSGHVGLMIGKDAHKELWPKVGEWLKKEIPHIAIFGSL
jgi:hypothetical protein